MNVNFPSPSFHRRNDGLAILFLAVCGLLLTWPLWKDGGYRTYLDNPCHLAEIERLAENAGWSEDGYAGFPVGLLHSPLWYGMLAAWRRFGLAFEPIYGGLVCFSLIAPALAMYRIARRRLAPTLAAGLAWLVLIQRPAMDSLGSTLPLRRYMSA